MLGLILRRLVQLPLIVLAVYTITLTLAWAVPGNPLENPEGRRPPPEVVAAMKAQYNLDDFWKFYGSYLAGASGLKYVRESLDGSAARRAEAAQQSGQLPPERIVFNLGPSLQYRDRSVNEIIASSLPISVTLGALAILIALLLGLTAGVLEPGAGADSVTVTVGAGLADPPEEHPVARTASEPMTTVSSCRGHVGGVLMVVVSVS